MAGTKKDLKTCLQLLCWSRKERGMPSEELKKAIVAGDAMGDQAWAKADGAYEKIKDLARKLAKREPLTEEDMKLAHQTICLVIGDLAGRKLKRLGS